MRCRVCGQLGRAHRRILLRAPRGRDLWLDSMSTERQFFTDDATPARADLRVNGSPSVSHDRESEVVLIDHPEVATATHLEAD